MGLATQVEEKAKADSMGPTRTAEGIKQGGGAEETALVVTRCSPRLFLCLILSPSGPQFLRWYSDP